VIPPAIFFYYSTLFDSRFKTLQQNPIEKNKFISTDVNLRKGIVFNSWWYFTISFAIKSSFKINYLTKL
ncbi:TPA: hypothetical protein ACGVSD_002617, partial [Enterococcus faecium]